MMVRTCYCGGIFFNNIKKLINSTRFHQLMDFFLVLSRQNKMDQYKKILIFCHLHTGIQLPKLFEDNKQEIRSDLWIISLLKRDLGLFIIEI